MMGRRRVERALLERLLSRVGLGTVRWEYRDGRAVYFGHGEPRSHVLWSDRATHRTLTEGTLGFCDGYVDGDWELKAGTLVDFMTSLVAAKLNQPIKERMPFWLRSALRARSLAAQAGAARRHDSVRSHYDLGTEFFRLWLDDSMTYTCGVARSRTDSLETMQRQKLELVCEKLRLKPGQRLLDLGAGWGSLAMHAATQHGAHVTAVNVSRPQLAFLEQRARARGLSEAVRTLAVDFRDVHGTFDAVAAVGLAEHVGLRQLPELFRAIRERVRPRGRALVHTIGSFTEGGTDDWIERRIFPGAYVPSLSELVQSAERERLRVVHVEDIGPNYALTLRHWLSRFLAAREEILAMYDERFFRIWQMYLTMLIPTFEHLPTCVYQLVLTRAEG
jgi:cyclopropane-fatty-acyl-phospholipid synthase